MHLSPRFRGIAGAALVAGLLLPAAADAAGRNDPLTPAEWQAACGEALNRFDTMMRTTEATPTGLGCLPPGLVRRALNRNFELLLVERRVPPKDMPAVRHADVYFYNYGNNVLHHFVVDVERRRKLSHEKMRGTQLPLTASEVKRSADLALADPDIASSIASEYFDVTGELLSSFDQLDLKAFAFHSSTLGDNARGKIRRCGVHRCAQLALAVRGVALELQPVVDLSRERVFDLDRQRLDSATRRSASHHASQGGSQ